MDETMLDLLMKKLDEDKAALVTALCAGNCADFPAYREVCGKLRGIAMARRHIEEMLDRLIQQEF